VIFKEIALYAEPNIVLQRSSRRLPRKGSRTSRFCCP